MRPRPGPGRHPAGEGRHRVRDHPGRRVRAERLPVQQAQVTLHERGPSAVQRAADALERIAEPGERVDRGDAARLRVDGGREGRGPAGARGQHGHLAQGENALWHVVRDGVRRGEALRQREVLVTAVGEVDGIRQDAMAYRQGTFFSPPSILLPSRR